MIRELLRPDKPCFGLAEKSRERIRRLGGESRIIYDGNGVPDLNRVVGRSLLAVRLSRPVENPSEFTSKEKELVQKTRNGGKVEILTITDFDGVLVSPVHTVHEVISGILRGEIAPGDVAEKTREKGKIGFNNVLGFARIIKASDKTIFWTSRFHLRTAPAFLKDGVSYFPFIDDGSRKRLEKFGQGKLTVVTNKPLGSASGQLKRFINQNRPDITYYIGSSERDREVVADLLVQYPHLSSSFVFFDAGHLYL